MYVVRWSYTSSAADMRARRCLVRQLRIVRQLRVSICTT